jgi:hypothetical protein
MKVRVYEYEPGWYVGQTSLDGKKWIKSTQVHRIPEFVEAELASHIARVQDFNEWKDRDDQGMTVVKEWEV